MQGVVWSQDLMGAVKSVKRSLINVDSVSKSFSLSKKETRAIKHKLFNEVKVQKQEVGTMSYWI
ncbi:hypothetical protein [Paenibacillus ginsengarvi]|uniref:Uncharacterized protein n=1 Tax=Paenibacillus ginsengarvi TaxID=400777 RepID=A0A3B0C9P0_9BACL|nr:hypothetical protein [Paenibacillus ginsengarvi]RKN80587.1 hypothetical protein D7M11_19065 [Paenibacillus ginsengarvi]